MFSYTEQLKCSCQQCISGDLQSMVSGIWEDVKKTVLSDAIPRAVALKASLVPMRLSQNTQVCAARNHTVFKATREINSSEK